MFGHILRSAENTQAQTALSFALEGASMHKSRRGRHQINLFNPLVVSVALLQHNFKVIF